MVTLDEFSRVVAEIYASSTDPTNWPVAMAVISRALDATGSGLVLGTPNGPSVTLGAGMPPEAIASYEQYYHSIDHILHACERSPVGLISSGQEINAGNTRSEFFNDWQRKYELDDGLFVQLSAGQAPASFAVSAPKRNESFDTAGRVQFVAALVRHLQQALRTQDHLAMVRDAATGIAEVIDAIPHGVAIVETSRGVVSLNRTAAEVFASHDGLRLHRGTIEATRTSVNQRLQSSIANALAAQGPAVRSGASVACSRPSGRRPFVIHIVPLATSPDSAPSAVKALLMIVDLEKAPVPPKALLQNIFGLTPAETDVALRVIRGAGLKPIAAELGISRATVNTHLQRVFDKTSTHRQAELARLLTAILP
jgi:DNA-binding CsgD family transcriptional regulator